MNDHNHCQHDLAQHELAKHEVTTKDCHPERSGTKWSAVEGPAVSAISAAEPAPANQHPLTQLRQFTPARIALGRSGNSLPTKELLAFSADHAMARDAVHAPFDVQFIGKQLAAANLEFIQVHSAAADRAIYLRRPDLGRKLNDASRDRLSEYKPAENPEVLFIIADGLSAIAPQRYAVRVIQATIDLLYGSKIGPIVIAQQARVALGDEIGEILSAEITVMLIGERPGLSSPDSLGIYLTYAPKPGRTDAERNCISNVREQGTNPEQAAHTLAYLLTCARRLKLSGVRLKDESGQSRQAAFPLERNL
jgi:ethanolamine ammonia-lyase small subunit